MFEDGGQTRDFVHVRDVARANVLALTADVASGAYNIASGQATTAAQMIDRVKELVPGAKLSVGPGPYRHGDTVESVKKGALDVSRAKAELGWAPKYDMRAGLEAYLRALQAKR